MKLEMQDLEKKNESQEKLIVSLQETTHEDDLYELHKQYIDDLVAENADLVQELADVKECMYVQLQLASAHLSPVSPVQADDIPQDGVVQEGCVSLCEASVSCQLPVLDRVSGFWVLPDA